MSKSSDVFYVQVMTNMSYFRQHNIWADIWFQSSLHHQHKQALRPLQKDLTRPGELIDPIPHPSPKEETDIWSHGTPHMVSAWDIRLRTLWRHRCYPYWINSWRHYHSSFQATLVLWSIFDDRLGDDNKLTKFNIWLDCCPDYVAVCIITICYNLIFEICCLYWFQNNISCGLETRGGNLDCFQYGVMNNNSTICFIMYPTWCRG